MQSYPDSRAGVYTPVPDDDPRPPRTTVTPSTIPERACADAQWVAWRYQRDPNNTKWTKVPYRAVSGQERKASSTDPNTWATFFDAYRHYQTNEWVDGIGFVVSDNDEYCGVDLDHCRDPETGIIDPWALGIVAEIPTYWEVSPSGAGLRAFCTGSLPPKGRKYGPVEMYSTGRFLTVTGHRLPESRETIEECTEQLARVHAEHIIGAREAAKAAKAAEREAAREKISAEDAPISETTTSRTNGHSDPKFDDFDEIIALEPAWDGKHLSDDDVIRVAEKAKNGDKFKRLWSGNTSDYRTTNEDGSTNEGRNEADAALLGILGFYCRGNRDQMDRLYRRSGLRREKWDRADYRERTLDLALTGLKKFFGDDRPEGEKLGRIRITKDRTNGHAASSPSPAVAEDAQEILDDVIESGSPRPVFDAVPILARLPRAAYGQFKADLKDILGTKINLNDLEAAVADTRRQNTKTAKAEAAEETPTANEIACTILEDDHFAQDDGGKLWVYQHGVYIPRGAARVKSRVKSILEARDVSDEWTSHLASETVEYIRVDSPYLWDRPPADILNLQNGLLDVRTGVLKPHTHHHLSAVQIPVTFDPDATCQAWETFVGETFPEDATDLAWELAAKLMTSDSAGQKATLFVGEGGNGKSTFLAGLNAFIGRSNVSSLSLHRLEADKFAAARLFGKLANICADLPSAHLSGTSIFKAITGGDSITGEYKYLESFDFVPFASLVFSANHPPQSTDGSQAFFDRWDVIPFNQSFRGTAREIPRTELDARLSAPDELSGLLNKALAVLPAVRRRGLSTPASCMAALDEFRAVTDPFVVWLDTATVAHPDAITPKHDLLIAYNNTRKKEGGAVMTEQAFGRGLLRHRPSLVESRRMVRGVRVWAWVGIGLRGDGSPPRRGQYESSHGGADRDVRDVRDSSNCIVAENGPLPLGEAREGVHSLGATDKRNPGHPGHPGHHRSSVVSDDNDGLSDDWLPICATDGCPNIVTLHGLDCDACLNRTTIPEAFR